MALFPHLEFWLRGVPGYALVQPALERISVRRWHRDYEPPAPRSVKAELITRFALRGQRDVFIETGTFFGDMIAAVRPHFARLYSIELDQKLARRAARRFADDLAISIVNGDSGDVLDSLIGRVSAPAVYWLDGHYSGFLTARGLTNTPVMRELTCILRRGTEMDVVLIDDARLFGLNPDYPSIEAIRNLALSSRPEWALRVTTDIVMMGLRSAFEA